MSLEIYLVIVILVQTVVVALLCYFRGSKGKQEDSRRAAQQQDTTRPVHPHEHVYLSEFGSVVHATRECSNIRASRNARRLGICRICGGHIRAACIAVADDGHES